MTSDGINPGRRSSGLWEGTFRKSDRMKNGWKPRNSASHFESVRIQGKGMEYREDGEGGKKVLQEGREKHVEGICVNFVKLNWKECDASQGRKERHG